MLLADYLKDSGLSDAEFGSRCKPPIDRTTIWRLKIRLHNPRADKVAAIEKASHYRVRAEDLRRHVANS